MPEFVTLETSDDHPGVGTILLARPPMNALSRQVQAELAAAAEEATLRDDIKQLSSTADRRCLPRAPTSRR